MELDGRRYRPLQSPHRAGQPRVCVDEPGAGAEPVDVAGPVLAELGEWIDQRGKMPEADSPDGLAANTRRPVHNHVDHFLAACDDVGRPPRSEHFNETPVAATRLKGGRLPDRQLAFMYLRPSG